MKIPLGKCITLIISIALLLTTAAHAQEFNKAISKDSLLRAIVKGMPKSKRTEFLKTYNSGSEQEKEFLLFMFSMPRSSKKAMTRNIDTNYEKINYLRQQYNQMVPKDFTVDIEFKPAENIVSTAESIDLKVFVKDTIIQEWNLSWNSDSLKQILQFIDWDNTILVRIKKLLADAHCISITNGNITNIGYARSGMGLYSFLLFDKNLSAEQVKQYNNGCDYIYYKKNIVLEYGGGAVGPQCFPD